MFVLPGWSTSRSNCPRTNEAIQGCMSTWRHQKTSPKCPLKWTQIRIMFSNDSNDSFRIGNISTLYISDSRGDQSRFGRAHVFRSQGTTKTPCLLDSFGKLPHRAEKMNILRKIAPRCINILNQTLRCHNSCDQWIEWGKFRESYGDFPEMTAKHYASLFHEFYMLNVMGNWKPIRLATQVLLI